MNENGSRLVARQDWGATPKQIQDRIEDPDAGMKPSDVYNLMPPEIKNRFRSNKGNQKTEDYKRFLRSLNSFMGTFSVGQLLQISEECIDREGRIIEIELRKILEDRNGSTLDPEENL